MNKMQQVLDAFRGLMGYPISPVPYDTPEQIAKKSANRFLNNVLYDENTETLFPSSPLHDLAKLGIDAKNYYTNNGDRETMLNSADKVVPSMMFSQPLKTTRTMLSTFIKPMKTIESMPSREFRVLKSSTPNKIKFDARTGKKFTAYGSKVAQTRPDHQINLEKAWNSKDYKKAQQIIDLIDDEPTKNSMQRLQDEFMKKGKKK